MSLAMKSQAKVKKKPKAPEVMEKPAVEQKISAQVFSFRDIAIATHNFRIDNLVGEGGFGRVYKGRIPGKDKTIAVKKLHRNGNQGNKEFLSEVSMLSQLSHPNLVNLIGYCTDGDQRILVFEYMANGCLENHLLDVAPNKEPLDWYQRMKIAHGVAKGLEYLHEEAKPPVIYRDFKTSNILLDEEFNARLCDFDLTKIDPSGENDSVSNRIMGTYGYSAPEYAKTGQFTTMSDVYSFGVVFLELISGRRAIDTTKPTEEQNLTTWAKPIFKDRKLYKQIIDPLLDDKYPENGFYQTIAVAAMILQDEPNTRPLISDIVVALEFLTKPPEDQGSPKGIIVTGLDEEDITDEDANNDKEENAEDE